MVGDKDSQLPASVTTIHPKAANDSGGQHVTTNVEEVAEQEGGNETSHSSNVPLYISIAAFIVGLIAMGISLTKRT